MAGAIVAKLISNVYTWMIFSFILIAVLVILIIFIYLLGKRTHAFYEWRSYKKKLPLFLFFNEDNTLEWKILKPETGLIEDKKYGYFVLNPQANYLDKVTHNITIPIASSVGATVPAQFAQITDAIGKVINDEKKMSQFRQRIMSGKYSEDTKKKLSFLRESINFSKVKSMLNNISPHNIEAKINLTISRKLGMFSGDQMKMLVAMTLIGLGLIATFAFVFWSMKGNQTPTKVLIDYAKQAVIANATKIIS